MQCKRIVHIPICQYSCLPHCRVAVLPSFSLCKLSNSTTQSSKPTQGFVTVLCHRNKPFGLLTDSPGESPAAIQTIRLLKARLRLWRWCSFGDQPKQYANLYQWALIFKLTIQAECSHCFPVSSLSLNLQMNEIKLNSPRPHYEAARLYESLSVWFNRTTAVWTSMSNPQPNSSVGS